MNNGYPRPLYILPFDHRSSFSKGLFGWSGDLTPAQAAQVGEAKAVIYDGFKLAIERGLPAGRAGILVDEAFGAEILRDASSCGYLVAMPLEKSGQEEFRFEYGEEYPAHIDEFRPTFCKVLVRYNPEGDAALNARQARRLHLLSEYLNAGDHLFMFELLVPPTAAQLKDVGDSQARYDAEFRAGLMVRAVTDLQHAGVKPDVWKVEGLDRREDCRAVAVAARRDGRDRVGLIVLGRGSSEQGVISWLRAGSGVPGFVGFAVGRTTFWEPLVAWRDGVVSREQAAGSIAGRYLEWVRVFEAGAEGGTSATISA